MTEQELIKLFYDDITKSKCVVTSVAWYLEQLDEPYRSQALECNRNAPKDDKCVYARNPDKIVLDSTPSIILQRAFTWRSSPQGHNYWEHYHRKLG